MEIQRYYFDETDREVYLDCYIADKITDLTRKAILILPGGAYGSVCFSREGEPIALAFLPYGFNAFVLHYSVNRSKKFPSQLIETALAIKYIKDNCKRFGTEKEVFVTGFSAGGHLTAAIGTLWKTQEVQSAVKAPFEYIKPKGILPIYPVVSGVDAPHLDSFRNLLCKDNPTTEELYQCSIEKCVDADSSPAFIVHTSNDQLVSVKNALALARAYADNNLQFELHIYYDAPHGVALGNKITKCGMEKYENESIAKWVENAVFWIEKL